jgi:hypothetical protein
MCRAAGGLAEGDQGRRGRPWARERGRHRFSCPSSSHPRSLLCRLCIAAAAAIHFKKYVTVAAMKTTRALTSRSNQRRWQSGEERRRGLGKRGGG